MTNQTDQSEIAREIIKQHERLNSNRGNWVSQWEEIAQRVIPSLSGTFYGSQRSPGEKRTELLFDSTAALALEKFSAILDSLLTPRNQTWHRLMVNDSTLSKNREVQLYFEEVNRILFRYRYAPKANFASQNQQNFVSLGGFGTGCLFTDPLYGDRGIRYRAIHLSEVCFAENHQGIVDEAYRKFPLTARQAVQKWGERLPDSIKNAVKVNPEQEYQFLHCVKPRGEDFDPSRADFKGMPFASHYVSIEGAVVLSESGFRTFPYAISRYFQSIGEIYGRSPAMSVLPAIKTLNEEKKVVLKQGHRTVDPILLAHDDGIADSFSLKPGAMNYGGVSADGRPLIHALPVGNIQIGKELMDDERSTINDAFLVKLFQILVETPTMTATEVLERTREKGMLLAPTVGRQQSEYLGPLIDRELDVLAFQNLLPKMPQVLKDAQSEYRTEYDSPLSRAQRAEEASGLMRTIEMTLNVVNVTQDHAPLDFFDWDTIIPEVSDIQGVPTRWMKSMDAVAAARENRAQQAQQQQMVQAAPGAAAMIKANAVANKGQ